LPEKREAKGAEGKKWGGVRKKETHEGKKRGGDASPDIEMENIS